MVLMGKINSPSGNRLAVGSRQPGSPKLAGMPGVFISVDAIRGKEKRKKSANEIKMNFCLNINPGTTHFQ